MLAIFKALLLFAVLMAGSFAAYRGLVGSGGAPAERIGAEENIGPGSTLKEQAEAQLQDGQTAAAFGLYLAAVEQNPDDLESRLKLTLLALLRAEWAAAEGHGAEVVRLAPDTPEAEAVRAALSVLDPAAPEAAAAAETARKLLEVRPDLLVARWASAFWMIHAGDPCKAIPQLDAAIASRPRLYELEELKLAAYQKARDGTNALRQLQQIHRKFPERSEPAAWLLDTYKAIGDVDAATELLREIAQNAGNALEPRLKLVALVREVRGDEAAADELQRLVEEGAGTSLAGKLSLLYSAELSRRGREAEAIALLDSVLALPDADPVVVNDAKVELARLLYSQGEVSTAEALVAGVLEQDAGHVEALKTEASWLIDQDRAEQALNKLQLASDQNPFDTEILILQAEAYRLKGSTALAANALARAVEISNGGARETAHLADLMRSMGRGEVADALEAMYATSAEPEASANFSSGGTMASRGAQARGGEPSVCLPPVRP